MTGGCLFCDGGGALGNRCSDYGGEVKRIALAGGIGAGKSTVLEHLRSLGLVTIDADDVAREVVASGSPVLRAIVDAFGAGVLNEAGELDRAFVASMVFARPENVARLNALTHPAIGREMRRQIDELDAAAVFVAIPLLRPSHRTDLALDEVWAVLTSPEVALERLTSLREMDPTDAVARIGAQMSNGERAALADVVIWNDGSPGALLESVDALLAERGLA